MSLPDRYGTVPVGRKDPAIASLTGSFALTRERPPSRGSVPLGGKLGGKIVKRRARGVVAAQVRIETEDKIAVFPIR